MKNIITFLFIFSVTCGFNFAQSSLPELEIVKEIKRLKSTKSDVKAIMSEFDLAEEEDDDESFSQLFRSDNANVIVSYSEGKCSKDEDDYYDSPEWNAPKMSVTKVVITFTYQKEPKLVDLGLDLSSFKKTLKDEEDETPEEFIYSDENAGIIILTDEGEIEKIILHPPEKQVSQLCKNESNAEILSGETNFIDSIVRSESYSSDSNYPSSVTKIALRANGVFGCKDEKCVNAKKEISVTTTAIDPENDQLVYNYTVSGGKIDGSGAIVVWDLTDVLPGTYTITAGTDDGCGICGETQSRKILVKENSYEIVPLVQIKKLVPDKNELLAGCPVGRLRRISCPTGNCAVSVTSVSEDKNLTYRYKAFSGEIIGSGDKVVWDLSGLKPGEYRIMASASDDGVGFGEWKEATVTIKENPACSAPKK